MTRQPQPFTGADSIPAMRRTMQDDMRDKTKVLDCTPPASVVVLTDYEASVLVELLGDITSGEHPAEIRNLARRIQRKVTDGRKPFMPWHSKADRNTAKVALHLLNTVKGP